MQDIDGSRDTTARAAAAREPLSPARAQTAAGSKP
jgi:hypothetical protein